MLLEVKDLIYRYGNKVVLQDIQFQVEEGDRLVILGNNGVGKTTLMKCLNQIYKPSQGDIYLNNQSLTSYSKNELAKKIAYVSQSVSLMDQSVFETILLGRKPYINFMPLTHDYVKTQETIEQLLLSSLAHRNTNHLSGGERQKVAIATAVNQDTEIIILDEPTANLDIKNQIEVCNFMKNISLNNHKTLIISMHDINLALKIGTKFLVLKDSKIYCFGDQSIITKELLKDVFNVSTEQTDILGQKNFIYI